MNRKLRNLIIIACVFLLFAAGLFAAKQIYFPAVEFMIPQDGQRDGIAAIGDYSGETAPEMVVAQIGDAVLTNDRLQVYYWAEVASHSQKDAIQPDFRLPLSRQRCPLDEEVDSWEQYFLKQALDTWHTAQALKLQGEDRGLPIDPLYAPDETLYEKLLTDKPATAYLYGYHDDYQLNTLHQKYMEQLPALFDALAAEQGYTDAGELAMAAFGTTEEALCRAASLYNHGYSYYTALSYLIEVDEAHISGEQSDGEPCVSFRQVLLIPKEPKIYGNNAEPEIPYHIAEDGTVSCMERGWTAREKDAKRLLNEWDRFFLRTEGTFGQMAFTETENTASKRTGGYYGDVVRGQVPAVLEGWLFDDARKVGDTTIIRSDYGVHILYFSERSTVERNAERDKAVMQKQLEIIAAAKAEYPMEVAYAAISLQPAAGTVSYDAFLYEDIAHERYPEMPLYLQNDYGNFLYGGYPMTTHGCGICSLAMVATYLTDTPWLPTQLSDMFGDYNSFIGTDVCLFWQALSEVDYYYVGHVNKDADAWKLLEDGYCMIVREGGGFWTKGAGHYITLEKLTDDGRVVVRDSSLLNFGRLDGHAVDCFEWKEVTGQAAVYLVFGKKAVHNDACVRCGEPDLKTVQLIGNNYVCPKCDDAILRRSTYLQATA